MLSLCKKEKDTFIEWLRILNMTYLSNLVSFKRL